jgi:TonB family protein
MTVTKWIAGALLVLAAQGTPNPAGRPEPLASSGGWKLDLGENACILSMDFAGRDKDRAKLTIQTLPGNSRARLVLQVPAQGSRAKPFRSDKGWIRFGSEASIAASYDMVQPAGDVWRTYLIPVDLDRIGGIGAATHVSFIPSLGDGDAITIMPVYSDRAAASLKACEDKLVKAWGFDGRPAQLNELPHTRPSGHPTGGPGLARLRGTTAGIVFSVDGSGAVNHCRIAHSSGTGVDDTAICKLIERARYAPAAVDSGKPVQRWTSRWVTVD